MGLQRLGSTKTNYVTITWTGRYVMLGKCALILLDQMCVNLPRPAKGISPQFAVKIESILTVTSNSRLLLHVVQVVHGVIFANAINCVAHLRAVVSVLAPNLCFISRSVTICSQFGRS